MSLLTAAAIIGGVLADNAKDVGLTAWSNKQTQKANSTRFAQEVELANTAHQREVQDLRAAGLNPILSTGTAGAAVPQQAAAEYRSPTGASGISDALNTAASLAIADKQADSIGYDAALKKIEVDAYHNASAVEKAQIQQGIRDEMLMRGAPKNPYETGYMGWRKGNTLIDDMGNRPSAHTAAPAKSDQRKAERFSDTPNDESPALPLVVPGNLIKEYRQEHNGHTPTPKEFEMWRRRRNAKNYKK